jgi:aldehyde dehydrogenase (NAD+)
MGGKNAVIVLSDADIKKAVTAVVSGAFGSTGQRCTATSRLILEEEIYDDFIYAVIEKTRELRIGYGLLPDIDIGPASSQEQLDQILRYIELGKNEGATLAYGGNRINGPEFDQGYYVEPTIFTGVTENMSIAQEEIFGPVLTCFKVKDFTEAIAICNNSQFGLSSSIYTKDLAKAFSYVNQIQTGMLHINGPTLGGEVHLPFGGTKSSGVGTREQGTEAINFFSEITTVYVDYTG